ncbi:histidine kinase N-terminal 7TM domain-containing diguanylate cyclase [Couchioplanes azureus]|uniref:histidine kinase N-terminal 7TM domain-containing diguanylate cyclase n=1 Tax=Couchioplanes caeruleus TaxID=56438 RepID=UPI0016706CBC|nr:diguanylate cyclase [Couchioplanes caeruleus]GGQ73098.1 GGDEF domain-containing protein [Couchioplanes caeruleus subsp. azureus]
MWRQALVLLFAVSALVAAAVTVKSWRRRDATAAIRSLVLIGAGTVVWAVADLCGVLTADPARVVLAKAAVFPAVCAVIAGVFCLCLAVVDRGWRLSRRTLGLLAVEPVLVSIAIATNPWHHLFVLADVRTMPVGGLAVPVFGPLFYAHALYSNVLLAISLGRLVMARRQAPPAHRRVMELVLVVVVPPVLVNTVVNLSPVPVVDVTVVVFTFSAALLVWGLQRRIFADLVPVAHQRILATIDDAVTVIDLSGRVLDHNPAAERLARRLVPELPATLIGVPVADLLGHLTLTGSATEHDIVDAHHRGIDLNVRVNVLDDGRGGHLGWTLVVRDTTETNRQRLALEDANRQLRDQLHTIELLRADLAEQAVRDTLTGLHNRRHLMAALHREVSLSNRAFTLVLIDIDHFKQVNDTYGHAVGDEVLTHVAGILADEMRHDDIVSRHGGEEFVLLLFGADPARARARIENLRTRLAATPVDAGGTPVSVTFSAGLTGFTGTGTPATLLAEADEALYRAKRNGRNRVELAGTMAALSSAGSG